MSKPVQMTMYEANDGSLHASKAMADWRDKQDAKERLYVDLEEVFRPDVDNRHFSSLSDSIFPFDSNRWHDEDIRRERERFYGELSELIDTHWEEFVKVMKGVGR